MGSLHNKHRAILYNLKRAYGLPIDIYRPTSESHDVETGEITRGFSITKVKRAPVLPHTKERTFTYDLDYIQAGNNFTEGGFFDRETVDVLIDKKDLPRNFVPTLEDHVVIRGKRYDIKKSEMFEQLATWRLTLSRVTNQREIWLTLDNVCNFEDDAEATLNE